MRLIRRSPERWLGFPLPERAEDVPEIEVLAEQLRTTPLAVRALVGKARFSRKGYVRRVLFQNEACELVLASWLPGQASAIHDHGGSHGAVVVLAGELTETCYAWRGSFLCPVSSAQCVPGAVAIERPETIHRVENTSTRGAVTLHLYTPPIRAMNRLDEASAPPASWEAAATA